MTPITPDLLRANPLPLHEAGDKENRGSVLVIGGCLQVPGGLLLAGTAVLRAGAGKLQLATCRSIAPHLGLLVPESLVHGLDETSGGGIAASNAGTLLAAASRVDAVLIGPGMTEQPATAELTAALLAELGDIPAVLDAGALAGLEGKRLGGRAVITPHCGEMARLLDVPRDEVERDPLAAGRTAAARLQCVVIMKGDESHVISPDGTAWLFTGGTIGLATSGSGDALAGLVVGLLGRGADPIWAAIWGVYLHGTAGSRLFRRYGGIGLLAREIPDEVPRLMAELA